MPSLLSRTEELKQFQAALRSADLKDDETFRQIVRDAQRLLELNDQEIADALSVSRPTVNRWVNGKNLPHNALRKPVCDWVLNQITRKLKALITVAKSDAMAESRTVAKKSQAGSSYSSAPTFPMAAKSR